MELLFSKDQLAEKVEHLGAEISKEYKGDDITVVAVLNGSIIFASDLIRQIKGTNSLELDSIKTSFAGDSFSSSKINFDQEIVPGIYKDRRVIIVNTIIDSGETINRLINRMLYADTKLVDLKLCVLVDKRKALYANMSPWENRKINTHVNTSFCAIEFEKEYFWIVGYGLDVLGKYGELESMYKYEEV